MAFSPLDSFQLPEDLGALRDDHKLIAEIASELGGPMYRVAISVVRDSALAEDVVQDSLIKVWDGLADYRGDAPLKNWALRITHNTAVSTLRRIRDEAWDPLWIPDEPIDARVESAVIARDELSRLELALTQIDQLSRSVLALREVEEMSYREIAEVLGITEGQVKIRLFRTRRRLAELVKGADHD